MTERKVVKWVVPKESDARLLCQPNIPHPLHGAGCQPRTLVEKKVWDAMRKECYEKAGDTCEICGQKLSGHLKDIYPLHHCHEMFSFDYVKKTSTFERLICLCPTCHTGVIHSGRALTMYKNHMPLWTKEFMLNAAEHGFQLVHSWNKLHPDEKPLRMFSTFEDWLKEPTLEAELTGLVEKYEIKFYHVPKTDTKGSWGKWKLIFNGVEYYSPYQNRSEWEAAMDKNNTKDQEANANLFTGDLFDKLKEMREE